MDDQDEMQFGENLAAVDAGVRKFYDDLSEISSRVWKPLEDCFYKWTIFG